MNFGKIIRFWAGILTLAYTFLGLIIPTNRVVFWIGIIAITLWLLLIIDIDFLLKKENK